MTKFDWNRDVTYDDVAKKRFHDTARRRLRDLAKILGFEPGSYDLRSNKAGPAVSGEITLHHDDVYIQVSQSLMGPGSGILYRTCNGRRDYTGGQNLYMPTAMLDDLESMATRVQSVIRQKRSMTAAAEATTADAPPMPGM